MVIRKSDLDGRQEGVFSGIWSSCSLVLWEGQTVEPNEKSRKGGRLMFKAFLEVLENNLIKKTLKRPLLPSNS